MPQRLLRSTSASTSLPSYFRFHPRRRSDSSFFNPYPEEDDPSRCLAPTVNSASARTRLEVLKGWEISFSVFSLYLATIPACLYVVVIVRRASQSWLATHTIPPLNLFDHVIRIALEIASVLLPIYYYLNLAFCSSITDEHIWTSVLLAVGLLATNPLTRDDLILSKPRYIVLTDSVYTATIYLYLLLAVHSYRNVRPQRISSLSFYLPKIAISLTYATVKLVLGLDARVSLGLIPFTRILTWLRLLLARVSSLRVTSSVLLTTSMDLAFAAYLVDQISQTTDYLSSVPYVEHRAKQLGFRCFAYQTLAFCICVISLSILTTFLLPTSYITYLIHNPEHIAVLEPPVARLAIAFIYFMWTLVLAYVNLPPTPFLHRALYSFISRLLHRVRNCPVIVWLGLADIITTAEAEDSGDETDRSPMRNITDHPRVIPYGAKPMRRPPVPMRYRHHELFDIVPSTFLSLCAHFGSTTSNTNHAISMPTDLFSHGSNSRVGSEPRNDSTGSVGNSYDSRSGIDPLPYHQRLRLRKNLLVMETQVLLVNIAYLAYIFGNPSEELKNRSPRSSEGDSRNGRSISTHDIPADNVSSQSEEIYSEMDQRSFDDGTMFRVNPYALAERYGYKVYKYFTCNVLNTHAVVLVNASRVIVSFSGTRDMANWKVNANIDRVVLDDRLTRFEYVLSNGLSEDVSAADQTQLFDVVSHGNSHHEASFDSEQSVDGNLDVRDRSSQVRRCVSDWNIASPLLTDACVPLAGSTSCIESYGSSETDIVYGTEPSLPSVSQPCSFGDESRVGARRRPHFSPPAMRRRVSSMANTFAHELSTFGKAKVHVGFLEAYMSVRKRILGALVELYGGQERSGSAASLPLFFTGHSLGGAMATFGCYEAARYYKRIGIAKRQHISCTTFGCPRMGNEAFKTRYERLVETHWRFEMAADPIPKVPTVILNYVPVGVQVLIDQSGLLLIDPSFIEVQWWGLANPYVGYMLHIRASYVMALRTYCKLYKHGIDDLANRFWPFPLRIQTKGLFRKLEADEPSADTVAEQRLSTNNG